MQANADRGALGNIYTVAELDKAYTRRAEAFATQVNQDTHLRSWPHIDQQLVLALSTAVQVSAYKLDFKYSVIPTPALLVAIAEASGLQPEWQTILQKYAVGALDNGIPNVMVTRLLLADLIDCIISKLKAEQGAAALIRLAQLRQMPKLYPRPIIMVNPAVGRS